MTRVAIAASTLLVLAGCAKDPVLDRYNAASQYCKDQVAATFDSPSTAVFFPVDGSGVSDGSNYQFTFEVTGDGQEFDLTCKVTGEPGSFLLASYNLVAAK